MSDSQILQKILQCLSIVGEKWPNSFVVIHQNIRLNDGLIFDKAMHQKPAVEMCLSISFHESAPGPGKPVAYI